MLFQLPQTVKFIIHFENVTDWNVNVWTNRFSERWKSLILQRVISYSVPCMWITACEARSARSQNKIIFMILYRLIFFFPLCKYYFCTYNWQFGLFSLHTYLFLCLNKFFYVIFTKIVFNVYDNNICRVNFYNILKQIYCDDFILLDRHPGREWFVPTWVFLATAALFVTLLPNACYSFLWAWGWFR